MRVFFLMGLLGMVVATAGCRSTTEMPPPLSLEPVNRLRVVAAASARGLVRADYYDRSIELRPVYAGEANAFGRVLYPEGFPVMLSQPTALKLAMANGKLRKHGLRLVVLDAYRPPEVQWQMYQIHRSERYVSDPRTRWSKHTYGRAVDVTVFDSEGKPVRMPSAFDDFSERAAAAYTGSDGEIRSNLARLQSVMTQAGFAIYPAEWWHFNDLTNSDVFRGPPIFGRDLGLKVAPVPE